MANHGQLNARRTQNRAARNLRHQQTPLHQVTRRRHNHLKIAVIHIRHIRQTNTTLQAATIRNQHRPHRQSTRLPTVHANTHRMRPTQHVLHAGLHVRNPAELRLNLLVRIIHDKRIKAGTTHHKERMFGFFAGGARSRHLNRINGLTCTVERNINARRHVTHRNIQVTRQQVTGTHRQNTQARLTPLMMRQRRRHSTHRTVTTGSNQQVNTLSDQLAGRLRTGLVHAGGAHQRLRVAVRREDTFQNLNSRRSAGLTRVVHHAHALRLTGGQGRQNTEGCAQFDSASARFTAGTSDGGGQSRRRRNTKEFTVKRHSS